jgi:hypothetical protein
MASTVSASLNTLKSTLPVILLCSDLASKGKSRFDIEDLHSKRISGLSLPKFHMASSQLILSTASEYSIPFTV